MHNKGAYGWGHVVYRWAYRILQNDHDALDATQTVLMKALESPQIPEDKRSAWLRRVTINHCFDQLRRRRVLSATSDGIERNSDPCAEIEEMERRGRISAALTSLSDVQRMVLLSKTYDNESFESIARSLNISASSVKTHYVRALKKMRDLLSVTEEDLK